MIGLAVDLRGRIDIRLRVIAISGGITDTCIVSSQHSIELVNIYSCILEKDKKWCNIVTDE